MTSLTPPAVTGLGYLDAVDEATLIALADPHDEDGDGVSGRLQIVPPSPLVETVLALAARSSPDPGARGTLVEGGLAGRLRHVLLNGGRQASWAGALRAARWSRGVAGIAVRRIRISR